MALKKPRKGTRLAEHAPGHEIRVRSTQRRCARIARVASSLGLPPSQASDLVESIPINYSTRKRRIAVELIHAFADESTVVRRGTFASLVGACRRSGELDEAKDLLARLHALGLFLIQNVYSSLMGELCAAGRPREALQLVQEMRATGTKPSNETLTVLVSSLGRCGHPSLALDLARRLLDKTGAVQPPVVYDLPLYNALLQALLAGGSEAEVRLCIQRLRSAGYTPSTRTLNVLLTGFVKGGGGASRSHRGRSPSDDGGSTSPSGVDDGGAAAGGLVPSMEPALDVFNSFCAAGGRPTVQSYNILLAGFAREGQLLNSEVLFSQLRQQAELEAQAHAAAAAAGLRTAAKGFGIEGGDGSEEHVPLAPDVYTYNALLLAAIKAGRPAAAVAHRSLMIQESVPGDAITLKLLVTAHAAAGRPLEGVHACLAALDAGEVPRLDALAYTSLLEACSAASTQEPQAPAARAALLELLRRMVEVGDVDTKPHPGRRSPEGDSRSHSSPSSRSAAGSGGAPATPYAGSLCTDGRVDASLLGVAAVLRAPSPAPWHATAHWQRDVLRTLGNARDFAGARRVFEGAPRPRRMVVWEEMIRVCNLCGEPGFASQVLAEMAQGQGGGGKMARSGCCQCGVSAMPRQAKGWP